MAHVRWQRESCRSIAFPPDGDLSCPPTDIIEGKANDFAGPQSQTGQEKEKGIIAASMGCPAVTRMENLPNLTHLKKLRD